MGLTDIKYSSPAGFPRRLRGHSLKTNENSAQAITNLEVGLWEYHSNASPGQYCSSRPERFSRRIRRPDDLPAMSKKPLFTGNVVVQSHRGDEVSASYHSV